MIQSINTAGGGQGGGGDDEKVKVSANDTTEGYLNGKLVAGTGITLTENNNGGNETLTVTATDTNDAAKVSANDTTAGFLNGKLVAGTNITFSENNDGSNETLTIAASGLTGFTASQNTASPNNTVNASRLLVDATSTNADAVIQPKGTGALLAQLPDGAATGGNKRGANALDLQTSRTSNTQVASGANAVNIGTNATASGTSSVSIFGAASGNTAFAVRGSATGTRSVAIGQNSTSSSDDSYAFGDSANASGINALALGAGALASNTGSIAISHSTSTTGSANASGYNSVAIGAGAVASQQRQWAFSSVAFSVAGDCQQEIYRVVRVTTNNTAAELTTNKDTPGGTNRIAIANDSTYTFRALVTARRTDADNESAGYKIEGVIDNNAGTTAFVGTPTVTVIEEDTAAWDVVVEADNTNDALVIKVTGEANKTIRWGAVVELMKVSG